MGVPNTAVATSHAIAIRVGGLVVGMIQSWAPSQSRTITPVYQLKPEFSGEIYENVPGNVAGTTIQVSRYDLFSTRMEQAWGVGFDIGEMLSNQNNPLEIQERWTQYSGVVQQYIYSGCWFSSLGRNYAVQGDRIINVSATINYVKKRKFV